MDCGGPLNAPIRKYGCEASLTLIVDGAGRYLCGNFAPIQSTLPLTPCTFEGVIPYDLAGGQYVRNGANPVTDQDLGRAAHWFDGDGMLSGVMFNRRAGERKVEPEFVNQYVLTDVYISAVTNAALKTPILPSIATLVNPLNSIFYIFLRIFRTLLLTLLSHLPGSEQAIRRISVANTAMLYHDGRALATCESGPPMHIALPELETVGWFNGRNSEGGSFQGIGNGYGGKGLFSFFREWTTGHPRVDTETSEMITFHSTFLPPYVQYSIVPSNKKIFVSEKGRRSAQPMLNVPVPGIHAPKMMHDFGVSRKHTVIMDLPLSLDPVNLLKNKAVVAYDPAGRSRFGVFPRHDPELIRWYETKACCIFHTANTWESHPSELRPESDGLVNLLACRMTSDALVYSAGDVVAPISRHSIPAEEREEEQCRLYFYQFDLAKQPSKDSKGISKEENCILHQWALSALPFEFPTLRHSAAMTEARYIYGCSFSGASFGVALAGRTGSKINSLVKIDVKRLIADGIRNPPNQITGCLDTRRMPEVLASEDPHDPIKVFMMPDQWYAQEPRFVPRTDAGDEDDGWLLTYVFDESQLDKEGKCPAYARSELWIIDAKSMSDVVAKIHLPQRVPYGLHGTWFTEEEIRNQRPIANIRTVPTTSSVPKSRFHTWRGLKACRSALHRWLA